MRLRTAARGFATIPLPSLLARLTGRAPSTAQATADGPAGGEKLPSADPRAWGDRLSALVARGEVRAPRGAVVLCHGLFGFDKRVILPFLVDHYWSDISLALERIGCKVLVARVPSTGDVRARAWALRRVVEQVDGPVNLLAHSMGGLDARYLLSHLPPTANPVLSLTTISTPHRGSPFMDYLRDVLGVGFRYDDPHLREELHRRAARVGGESDRAGRTRQLARSFEALEGTAGDGDHPSRAEASPLRAALESAAEASREHRAAGVDAADAEADALLPPPPDPSAPFPSIPRRNESALRHLFAPLDRPAYHALTTDFCTRVFNPLTPDRPGTAYFSYGARADEPPRGNLLRFSWGVVRRREGDNDGLVSLGSARWGEYLGTVDADHWDLNGRWRVKPGGKRFDAPGFWVGVATRLWERGF